MIGSTQKMKLICISTGAGLMVWSAALFAATPEPLAGFPVVLNGEKVSRGAVAIGDVNDDGVDDIVVGAVDGKVHAYRGNGVKLWEYDTGAMGIQGKAAIADVDGDGKAEVIIGAGSPDQTGSAHGGLYVISHTGSLQCQYLTGDHDNNGFRDGVYGPPAVGDIVTGDGGALEIAFAGWDWTGRVINHDCSLEWERNLHDTSWSSPAIGDLDKDGDLDVIVGSPVRHTVPGFSDGGLLHAFDGPTGADLTGFPIQINETIQSSPSLGDLDGDGWLDIVVGTGYCWANPACAPGGDWIPGAGEYINAWDHNGNYLPGWPVSIPGTYAVASPALADLDEDGQLEVIVNTRDADDIEGGRVHVLNANGSAVPGWPQRPTVPKGLSDVAHNQTIASPVVADITGDGHLDVILPCAFELVVWDRNGNQLSRNQFPPLTGQLSMNAKHSVDGTPGVGDVNGDGDLEVVVGSANVIGGTPGAIYAWEFSASATAGLTPWPVFRGTPSNDALYGTVLFADGFESGNTSAWSNAVR